MPTAPTRRETRWILALVGALLAVFTAAQLQFLDDPYHWDSLYYVTASARDLYLHPEQIVPQGPWDNGHPPLFFWLLAMAWRVAGPSVIVSHLLVLAFALATLAGQFLLARRLFGSRAAFLASLFLAASPIFFYQAGTITSDIPLAALTVAALLAAIGRRWALAAAAGCAMVLIRESALLFMPFLAAAAWLIPDRRERSGLAGLAGPTLMVALPGAALGAWLLLHHDVAGWWVYVDDSRSVKQSLWELPYEIYRRTLRPFLRRHGMVAATVAALVALGAALPALRRPGRAGEESRSAWIMAATTAGMVIPIGITTAMMSIFLPRYILPILPVFFLLAGWAASRAGGAMPIVAILVMVPLIYAHEGPFLHGWESNRSFQRFIATTQESAQWLRTEHPDARVMAPWPLWQSICEPMYGYVDAPMQVLIIGTRERFEAYCSPGMYHFVPRVHATSVEAGDFDYLWLFTPRQLENEYAELASRVILDPVHEVHVGEHAQYIYRVRGSKARLVNPMEITAP
jgi:4-amino-4-deoxy-L-arabinose transferase-like glycosyltransferase